MVTSSCPSFVVGRLVVIHPTPPSVDFQPMEIQMQVSIGDFLNDDQIEQCTRYWFDCREGKISQRRFHELVKVEIIESSIDAIDRKLGQKNDPAFLAYAVEYAFMHTDKKLNTGVA
jgi:hypothetical protein